MFYDSILLLFYFPEIDIGDVEIRGGVRFGDESEPVKLVPDVIGEGEIAVHLCLGSCWGDFQGKGLGSVVPDVGGDFHMEPRLNGERTDGLVDVFESAVTEQTDAGTCLVGG